MASEWGTATIEEVTERVAMGPFGSSIKVDTFVPAGVPVVTGQHLHGFKVDGRAGFNFITREHADRLKNANVKDGDIVLTHRGNIGQVAMVPTDPEFERYVVSQSQFCLRCDRSKVVPEFLVAYFKSPQGQHDLLANTSQVGVPSIAQPVTYLRTLVIPLPPLSEQRAIAHILGTLDDKIELNRRMSETLEAMARAVFKSWFVDFDPVRAKMDGRWKPGQSLPGLPAHAYHLFPDRLTEHPDLGEIPKEWRACRVDDEFEITMGQSPPGSTYNEIGNGLPFYQGRADFGVRFPGRRVFCTSPTRLAKAGDTLITVRAPVGDINMAWEDCAIGRGVAAARHRTATRSYTYLFMHGLTETFARFEAEGTVFGSINKRDFHAIPCVGPPSLLVRAFETVLAPLDSRLEVSERETHTLAALRDALLPRLISGEVRVDNPEKFMKMLAP